MDTPEQISDDRKLILELLDDLNHTAETLEHLSRQVGSVSGDVSLIPGGRKRTARESLLAMSLLMKTRVTEIEASLSLIPAPTKLRDMTRKQEGIR